MVKTEETFNNVLTQEQASRLTPEKALADLGNGQTDIEVNGNRYVFDSGYRRASLQDIKTSPQGIFEYGKGLIESVYVQVFSTAINTEQNKLLAFGPQMKTAHGSIKLPNGRKVKTDSPILHLLTVLAVNKVQEEFNRTQSAEELLGQTYSINVDLLTALPARESTFEEREAFTNRLLGHNHKVTVFLAQTQTVEVQINFVKVEVKSEGSLAYNAMLFEAEKTFNTNEDIFREAREMYGLPEFGGKDIAKSGGYKLLLDIGEITTEGQVFDNMNKLVVTKSDGLEAGTKHVYDIAAKTLSDKDTYHIPAKKNYVSRREITAALKDPNHPGIEDIVSTLEEFSEGTASEIADFVEELNDNLDGKIKIVIVIGGGSIIMKEALLPMIRNIIEQTQPDAKVVYVPKDYAQEIFHLGMKQYSQNSVK